MKCFIYICIFAILLLGCQEQNTNVVTKHKVTSETLKNIVQGRCELISLQETNIRVPVVSRKLDFDRMKLVYLIEEGSLVKPGQVVAKIDVSEVKTTIRKLEADVKIAEAALESAQKNLEIEKNKLQVEVDKLSVSVRQKEVELRKLMITPGAMARLEAKLAWDAAKQQAKHKQQEMESHQFLMQKQITSSFDYMQKQLEYSKSVAAAKQKELELETLKLGPDPLEVAKLRHDLEKERIALKQAQNDLKYKVPGLIAEVNKTEKGLFTPQQTLEQARDFLTKAEITSPVEGIVLHQKIWSDSGKEKIKKGMQLRGGSAFLSIQDTTGMQVSLEIPESEINLLQKSQKAIVEIDSIKNKEFAAEVSQIDTIAKEPGESEGIAEQQEEKETREEKFFEVFAQLLESDPRLKPGFTGTVKIEVKVWPDAIWVPKQAIFRKDKDSFVYVLNDDLEERSVKIAATFDDKVVIESGLKSGEEVLLESPEENSTQHRKYIVPYNERRNLELVVFQPAIQGNLEHRISETGTIFPESSQIVQSRIRGELTFILPEGAAVNQGEKVFVIEKSSEGSLEETILQKQTLQAEVEKCEQELKLTENNQKLEIQKTQLEVELAQLELQILQNSPIPATIQQSKIEKQQADLAMQIASQSLEVGQTLYQKNLISEVELGRRKLEAEKSKAQQEVAKVKHNILLKGPSSETIKIAEEKLRLAQVKHQQAQKTAFSNINKFQADLKVAQTKLQEQEYLLQYSQSKDLDGTVLAPSSGVIRHYKSMWRGKPEIGKECRPGQSILSISNEREMVVKTKVSEVDRYLIRKGQKVNITLPSIPGKKFTGEVVSVSQLAIDRSESANSFLLKKLSGVMVFEAIVKIHQSDADLKTGMSAEVDILLEQYQDVVMIPNKTLLEQDNAHIVYVLKDGAPRKTQVKIGPSNYSYTVVYEGIAVGDMLCLPQRLIPLD